jgi:hypothetical protein
VSENGVKVWPGTESNRRHEDFQNCTRRETIVVYRQPLIAIEQRLTSNPPLLSRFKPIVDDSFDKVIDKVEPGAAGKKVCAPRMLNPLSACKFLIAERFFFTLSVPCQNVSRQQRG